MLDAINRADLIAEVAKRFPSFGGGKSGGNPVAAALADREPMFAAGADIGAVVDCILSLTNPAPASAEEANEDSEAPPKKLYRVKLAEKVYYLVDVEAEDEDQAGELAAETWAQSEDPMGDFEGQGEGVTVCWVEAAP